MKTLYFYTSEEDFYKHKFNVKDTWRIKYTINSKTIDSSDKIIAEYTIKSENDITLFNKLMLKRKNVLNDLNCFNCRLWVDTLDKIYKVIKESWKNLDDFFYTEEESCELLKNNINLSDVVFCKYEGKVCLYDEHILNDMYVPLITESELMYKLPEYIFDNKYNKYYLVIIPYSNKCAYVMNEHEVESTYITELISFEKSTLKESIYAMVMWCIENKYIK